MRIIEYTKHPSKIKGWLLVNKPQWFRDDEKFLIDKWFF